ncbi:MAG: leucyl/phenylalanyl-tRNA--protein transferase [Pedobacter sp.]|jgi:leucyl/phenylalanyl-tRNA--protein transferase|nr:leucyl/phenylalanyl-tRNA--protein transferase [Pedobacter sp.]
MVFRLLDDEIVFPEPAFADEDGLLAVGGDLSPERLLLAYQSGIFPWFSDDDPILWFAPHERCVVFPEHVKVSKSMAKVLKSGTFKISRNQAFKQVIENCSAVFRKDQDGTWITSAMRKAYIRLHELGIAHSFEVWHNEVLVGGLYGNIVGKVFCGESMFSLMTNASKAAFICLCRTQEFDLIDCQMPNDHLMSLGAEMIPRAQYMEILNRK